MGNSQSNTGIASAGGNQINTPPSISSANTTTNIHSATSAKSSASESACPVMRKTPAANNADIGDKSQQKSACPVMSRKTDANKDIASSSAAISQGDPASSAEKPAYKHPHLYNVTDECVLHVKLKPPHSKHLISLFVYLPFRFTVRE